MKKILCKKWLFIYFIILEAVLLYVDMKYMSASKWVAELLPVIKPFIEIMYTSLVNFAAMWITCYLLIAQVFKDRYSLENAEEIQLTPMSAQLNNIITAVAFGVVMMFLADYNCALNQCVLTMCGYCLFTFWVIVSILWSAKTTAKTMMTNTLVNKTFKNIRKELKKSKTLSKNGIRNLEDIFEESVLNDESCVVENIIQKTEEIVKEMLDGGLITSPEDAEFKKIVDLCEFEIKALKDSPSGILVRKIFEQQTNILSYLIENKPKFFHEYFGFYCKTIYRIQSNNDDVPRVFIKNSYYPVLDAVQTVIEKKRDGLLGKIINHIAGLMYGLRLYNYEENIVFYAHFWYFVINKYFETNKKALPGHFVEVYCDEMMYLVEKTNGANHVLNGIRRTFVYLIEQKNAKFVLDMFKRIFLINAVTKLEKNKEYNMEIAQLFYTVLDNLEKSDITDNQILILECVREVVIGCISSDCEDSDFINYDVFCRYVANNKMYTADKLVSDYVLYARACLQSDNKEFFKNLLWAYEEFYQSYEDKETPIRFYKSISKNTDLIEKKEMLDIFLRACSRFLVSEYDSKLEETFVTATVLYWNEREQLEVIKALFRIFLSCKSVEHKAEIREDLIDIVYNCKDESVKYHALKALDQLQSEMNCETNDNAYVINALADIEPVVESRNIKLEIVKILEKILQDDGNQAELVYRRIYNICASAIENGDEETLKYGFNRLGWGLLNNLQNSHNEQLCQYIYSRIDDLYSISQNFDTSHRTKITMLTLYVIVGMYCWQHRESVWFDKIASVLRNEKPDNVKLAVKIRLNETNDWDGFFTNDEKLRQEFIKEVFNI